MALVLHAGNTNKNAFKTLIAADYSGIQLELTKNFEIGVLNKTSEFLNMNPIGQAEESAISCLKRPLGALNPRLAVNTCLVGHSVTLADIIMTCNLYFGFSLIMLKSFTSEFPRVERYFWTMVNQPNFRKVLGAVKQADSVPSVPSQKNSQTKEVVRPKEVKKEPKQEAVKPKVQEVVEEEEEAPKPNPRNPLDLLPSITDDRF